MSDQATVKEIREFLERMKVLVSSGKYDFVPRRKNMMALARNGLTLKDAKYQILGLVVQDYYKGPKQESDKSHHPGDIWEFKKIINNEQFYVKVKIVEENGEDILKCLGFHEDEFA